MNDTCRRKSPPAGRRKGHKSTKTKKNNIKKITPVKVQGIYYLLGSEAVLLPVPYKKKGCRKSEWQKTSWKDTQTTGWQRELNKGNIAVLTGQPSNGVVAIDFDSDESLKEFLALNPDLTESTRTKGNRGAVIWIRVKGDYPDLRIFKVEDNIFAEWKSTGGQQNISGIHPEGIPYRFIVKTPPVEINFAEIVWPDQIQVELQMERLVEAHGEPFWTNKNGQPTLNENFWAALYAEENCLLFEPNESKFFRYDDSSGLWLYHYKDIITAGVSKRLLEASKTERNKFLERKRTSVYLKNIVFLMQGIAAKPDAFKKDQDFVHVANNVITFKDEIHLVPFSPNFYSRNASPISYVAGAECPRFLEELLLPAVGKDNALLIQKWAGMALTGRNLIQRIPLLTGTPGRGKTTIVSVLEKLIGQFNVAELRTEHLAGRFELFACLGKTLLTGKDVAGDFLMKTGASQLKKLVGGDLLEVEGKGINERFQMVGQFNVIITCNSRLRIRLEGDVEAWRRRLIIINIDAQPPGKKIPGFDEILIRDEGPGILNWALAGFTMLLKDIDERGDIRLRKRQQVQVDALLAESESARHFIIDRIERADGEDLTVDELLLAYGDYCADNSWVPMPVTIFQRELPNLMLELFSTAKSHSIKREDGSKRGFYRVRFKNESKP